MPAAEKKKSKKELGKLAYFFTGSKIIENERLKQEAEGRVFDKSQYFSRFVAKRLQEETLRAEEEAKEKLEREKAIARLTQVSLVSSCLVRMSRANLVFKMK